MWQRSVYHLGPSRLGNQEIISCGGGGHVLKSILKMTQGPWNGGPSVCVATPCPPRPNRINNEPWWTSHLTFSAMAEICGLAKRLFPREGLIPRTPEQWGILEIFLYHTDFFRG